MLLKLAWRNIRHSVRDYTIYFLTLLFGVAVFYAFNSIGGQEVMFDLQSEADERQFQMTEQFLSMFSGLIACVLGFLILYSNGFLIRRRKREFGTYMLLGMAPSRVSAIMLIETVLVGLISLALGLIVGFLLSQAMSFFTAWLFGTTIINYQFVFSPEAFRLTILYFAIIYVVVALFNTFIVNRQKLIDLLHANAKNQKAVTRNPWVCLVAFVASIAILAYAYEQLIESGLVMLDDPRFMRATIGMLVGTFILFWSLAGFIIALITRVKGVYLRGLTPFTVRQIASRVNTAFVSLWAVCVMLFFSITTFSVGMGMVSVFTDGIEEANPYSATLTAEVYQDDAKDALRDSSTDITARARGMQADAPERYENAVAHEWDMAQPLRDAAPELWEQTIQDSAQLNLFFLPGITYGQLISQAGESAEQHLEDLGESSLSASNVGIVSLSDMNAVRTLIDQEPIALADDQCVIANNMEVAAPLADDLAGSGLSFDALGHQLTLTDQIITTQIEDNTLKATALTIVVPDAVVDALWEAGAIPARSLLDVMYADNGRTEAENDEALEAIVAAAQPLSLGGFEQGFAGADDTYAHLLWPVTRVITAFEMIVQASGLKMMITYLALYIGLIFLLATAAVLAVQQLSQTADSLPRYRMLSRIGCSAPMINRSLLIQVLVYFLLPLGVAACHASCAISVLSKELFDALGTSVIGPISMAAVLVAVIYGGYLLVTYLTSRSVVSSSLHAR